MDSTRFDAVTRTFAQASTRRAAVRRLGGSLGAILGVSTLVRPVAAQPATPESIPAVGTSFCSFGFTATERQGPDAGRTFAGTLLLSIGADGAIDHGALLATDAAPVAVVGQVTGRAVNLLFTLGTGKVVYGVGTAEHALAGCQPGALGGPLVGPAAGDAGDWALRAQSPATAEACSKCLAANDCDVRPGTDACKSCLANYCS